jgi:hypothetical protein
MPWGWHASFLIRPTMILRSYDIFRSEDATCNDKIVKAGVDGPFLPLFVSHLFSASTVGVPNAIYHLRFVSWGRDLIFILLLEHEYIFH